MLNRESESAIDRPIIHDGSNSPSSHTKHGLYSSDGMKRLSLHVDAEAYASLKNKDVDTEGGEAELVSVGDVKADLVMAAGDDDATPGKKEA